MKFANDQVKFQSFNKTDWDDSKWFRSVVSQQRDFAANANCSPVESARAVRAWAASRANNPAFAAQVAAAKEQAAFTVWANRPRAV
jgi:hypothetical protein